MSRSPLVLIVDDARDNREAYAEYLRFCGFRTLEAATGEEALKESSRCRPDVVLLDLRLPDLAGIEVSRRLRSMDPARHVPIIALSACVFEKDVAAAIESGCDAFLAKPCLPDAVVTEIRRLLAISAPAESGSHAGCSRTPESQTVPESGCTHGDRYGRRSSRLASASPVMIPLA